MSKTDFQAMRPREIESYFRQLILACFGNKVEDESIARANRGNYYVAFVLDGASFDFSFKKKSAERVATAIRALK